MGSGTFFLVGRIFALARLAAVRVRAVLIDTQAHTPSAIQRYECTWDPGLGEGRGGGGDQTETVLVWGGGQGKRKAEARNSGRNHHRVVARIGVDEALHRYDEHPGGEIGEGLDSQGTRTLAALLKAVFSTTVWGGMWPGHKQEW